MNKTTLAARFNECRTYGQYLSAKVHLAQLTVADQMALVDTMIATRKRVKEGA